MVMERSGELPRLPREFNSPAVRVPRINSFHFQSCCQLAKWGPPKWPQATEAGPPLPSSRLRLALRALLERPAFTQDLPQREVPGC